MQEIGKEYATLIEVRAQQAEMLTTLKEITSDHEKRIRLLERIMGYGVGALGAAKLVLDLLLHK